MNLSFVTGARSEYGVMKNVIKECRKSTNFNISIIATGMHYQQKYGETIKEIESDAIAPIIHAPCYVEETRNKVKDFIELIDILYKTYISHKIDIIYIVGDRLEAYAAALAAHFLKIKIAHFGGGQITTGAIDNIYRYNISNLADIHFVTNTYAEERLKQLPVIDNNKVFFVGSSAVDSIMTYLSNPRSLISVDSRLVKNSFVLMTFHPQTIGDFNVPKAMNIAIKSVTENGKKVLLTYPNNDEGCDAIIKTVKKWDKYPNVITIPNLGAENYYAAIDNSLFVIGNSSSGVIEVPYFSKFTINVGLRQNGRNAPKSVINIESDYNLLKTTIKDILEKKIVIPKQEYIYGRGDSIGSIVNIIKKNFEFNVQGEKNFGNYSCERRKQRSTREKY